MGTNYYARILPKKERKKNLIEAIEKDQFDVVARLTQELYGSRTTYDEGAVIHLGKRSWGWKFLWNSNIRREYIGANEWKPIYTYPLTKKGISDFLHRDDVVIVSEYYDDELPIEQQKEEILTADEFMEMALNWCSDGYDSKSYYENNKEHHIYHGNDVFWESIGIYPEYFDFESDGLRFSTSLEFS